MARLRGVRHCILGSEYLLSIHRLTQVSAIMLGVVGMPIQQARATWTVDTMVQAAQCRNALMPAERQVDLKALTPALPSPIHV